MNGRVIFLLGVLSSSLVFPHSLQAEVLEPDGGRAGNAAAYYLEAFELLQDPESEGVYPRVERILKEGWMGEDPEVEELLRANGPALAEFDQGVSLEKSDFSLGSPPRFLIDRESPKLAAIRWLMKINFLRARREEKQGLFDTALTRYLASLTLSSHVAQEPDLVSKVIALTVEKETFPFLRDFLSQGRADGERIRQLVEALEKFKGSHFPARALAESEQASFISMVVKAIEGAPPQSQAFPGFLRSALPKGESEYKAEVLSQAKEAAGRHYGNFALALETGEPEDWAFAEAEFDEMMKPVRSRWFRVQIALEYFRLVLTQGKEGVTKMIARSVVLLVFAIADPPRALSRAGALYRETTGGLGEILTLAGARQREAYANRTIESTSGAY